MNLDKSGFEVISAVVMYLFIELNDKPVRQTISSI